MSAVSAGLRPSIEASPSELLGLHFEVQIQAESGDMCHRRPENMVVQGERENSDFISSDIGKLR